MFYTEEGSFDQLKHLSIFASSLRCGAKISVFLSYLEGRGRIYSPWGVDSVDSRILFYVWSPRGTSLQGGEVHIHFFGRISMCGHLAGLHYRVGKFIYISLGRFLCVSSDRHRRDTVRDILTRCGAQFTTIEGPLIGSYMHGTGIRATRTFLCINAHRCLSALHALRSLEWGLWVS